MAKMHSWQTTASPHLDDGGQVHQLAHLHVSTVTPGKLVHRCAFLPLVLGGLLWRVFIFAVVVATMFTSTACSPSVIGHNSILRHKDEQYMQQCRNQFIWKPKSSKEKIDESLLWQGCHYRAMLGTGWSSSRCPVLPSPRQTRGVQVCTWEIGRM